MKTKLLLIALVAGFTFTSCEKCKDCTIAYETINGFDISELDADAVTLGHADFGSFYMDEIFDGWYDEPGESCGEDLKEMEDEEELEDLDENGTMDFRVYWDCK